MADSVFPIMRARDRRGREATGLTSVPWGLMAPHEARALKNHDQTLRRLAERGGLSPREAWCVLNDRPWRDAACVSEQDAEAFLIARVAEYAARGAIP
jgi:hypothetical protein